MSDPKFDFPDRVAPSHFYIVSAAARSGSTLLCDALWRTGVLGAPTEYFNFHYIMFQLSARLGATSLDDYVARLFAVRTSPNGVFGVKAHWDQLQFMLLSGASRHFPHAKWVRVGRRDAVAQAISFVKARQTGQWNTLYERRGEPNYDFERIARAYRRVMAEESERDAFFNRFGIEPLTLYYEELAADLPAAVTATRDFLAFPAAPAGRVSVPAIERQADETSAQWRAQFEQDAAAQGLAL